MRTIALATACFCLADGIGLAQTPPASPHAVHAKKHHAAAGGVERPVDVGPYTPQANAAYQGGGVILEGPPGAPAPRPEPTPPGQTPRYAVPQGE